MSAAHAHAIPAQSESYGSDRKPAYVPAAPREYNDALKGGFSMDPHGGWLDDLLLGEDSPINEIGYLCLRTIFRQTCGAKRDRKTDPAPEWAVIPLDLFARFTRREAVSVQRDLNELAARGLIERKKQGRGVAYKLTPERWKDAEPFEARVAPPRPEKRGVAPRAALKRPAPEPASAGADPTLLVVMPGAMSAPLTLRESIDEVQWRNTGSVPLRLAWSAGEDGLLSVAAAAFPPAPDVGRSRITTPPGVVSNNSHTVKQPRITTPGCAVSTTQTTENKQIELLEAELLPLFLRHFGRSKVPSAKLCDEIFDALGGAPLDLFMEAVHERLKRPMGSPQHLLNVAEDVCKAYTKHNEIAERERAAADVDRDKRREGQLDYARWVLSRPPGFLFGDGTGVSARDRADYLEAYPELANEFPSV